MLKNLRENLLMFTDCYNLSHERLKCDQSWEVSHMYNRTEGMILYGFQEIVTNLLSEKITIEMVQEADEHARSMGLIFPVELFERIVNECDGYIPIKVESLPEGTWCPKGVPFAQVSNTVEGFGELVTWFEAIFMMAYFPSSCATRALQMREYLKGKQKEYGHDDSFLWRFHSFGFRGHKSMEDAYWAGTAWSMFLAGTDDFHIRKHLPKEISMGSIPALAHKVTQQYDDEFSCFIHAIDEAADKEGIVALVIDTYDARKVIKEYIVPLARHAKEKGVKVVFRPDSGDVYKQAVDIYEIVKVNALDNVAVIIGEGMSFKNAKEADKYFQSNGVPLNFISYGIGAGFYKDIERDTLGWAMKTAYSNSAPRMKVVKSDTFKQSIPNRIHLKYNNEGKMIVHDGKGQGLYETVYEYIQLIDENEKFVRHIPLAKIIDENHFIEVKERALSQDTSQQIILLSEETQALIKSFHNKYNN